MKAAYIREEAAKSSFSLFGGRWCGGLLLLFLASCIGEAVLYGTASLPIIMSRTGSLPIQNTFSQATQEIISLNDVLLGRLFEELSSGNTSKAEIGIVGGSISSGHGCRCETGFCGYTDRVRAWFSDRFPPVEFTVASAAEPGTQSNFGSLCLNTRISRTPNILILEYAVNDFFDVTFFSSQFNTNGEIPTSAEYIFPQPVPGTPSLDIVASVERIIRWAHVRYIPVIIIYSCTTPPTDGPGLLTATWPSAAPLHRIVAEHYDIAGVDFGDYVFDTALYVGKHSVNEHSKFMDVDGRHPNCPGHELLAALITYQLRQQYKQVKQRLNKLHLSAIQYLTNFYGRSPPLVRMLAAASSKTSSSAAQVAGQTGSIGGIATHVNVLPPLIALPHPLNPYTFPDEDAASFECSRFTHGFPDKASFEPVNSFHPAKSGFGCETETTNAILSFPVGPVSNGLAVAYLRSWRRTGTIRAWLTPTANTDIAALPGWNYTIINARVAERATELTLAAIHIPAFALNSVMPLTVNLQNLNCEPDPPANADKNQEQAAFDPSKCSMKISAYFKF